MPPTKAETEAKAAEAKRVEDEAAAAAGDTTTADPTDEDVLRRAPDAHPQIVDLKGCARCRHSAHPGLTFEPLDYPIPDGDGEEPWTHWAECPTNGQPILFRERELAAEPEPVPPNDEGTA